MKLNRQTKNVTSMLATTLMSLVCLFFTSNTFAADPGSSQRQAFDPKLKLALQEAVKNADSFDDKYDATVWLSDMSNRLSRIVDDHDERMQILTIVHREATKAGVQPELVLAVMEVESAFDRYAISVAGARGLMQIMPFWLDEIGTDTDNLFHIDTNIRFGCTILKYYIDIEKGDLFRALGRYNGSLGRAKYPNKVFRAVDRRWFVQ